MRSQVILLLTLLLSATTACSQAQAPKTKIDFFEGSFGDALKKAKAERKRIFLDAYASWCGPCKAMERDVFTDPAVADFFNANFISLHIDMEKGEGPALAERLPSINGYPSLLFFDADGNLNKTILGSRHTDEFLAEAKLAAGIK